MSLSLALSAAAVYAVALLLSRFGAAGRRRRVLVAALALVAALPLLRLGPTWSPPAPTVAAPLVEALDVLQEPPGDGPAVDAGAGMVDVTGLLGVVWAIGLGVSLLRLGADLLAVHRLRAAARDRRGAVAYSDQVRVPLVAGALRPLVLLPAVAADWPASRRELALAHERAHVRGRDNLWLLGGRILACAHWFDPLAWLAVNALRDACEHHADDVVLASGADPVGYADALIAIARDGVPRLGLAMARRSGLERRVRAVIGPRRREGALAGALGVGVLVLFAVGTATAARPARAPAGGWQAVLEAEADRLVADYRPEGVAIVVLDARTGAVLGEAERGGLLDRRLSPGSVVKPFLVAAALEAGTRPEHAFEDGDMGSILERSSNVGARQIAAHVGRGPVADVLRRVGLPVDDGLVPDRLAVADGVLVTPRQVASAYTHLTGRGAIAPPIAATTREIMERVVHGERGTGQKAAVDGLRVAGKTGTAPLVGADGEVVDGRVLASFVGLVPADDPELVVLVDVAAPQAERFWGGEVAAPAFRRVVEAR